MQNYVRFDFIDDREKKRHRVNNGNQKGLYSTAKARTKC